MSRIFWDTNVFIYYLEGHPIFGPPAHEHYDQMLRRDDEMMTSAITLGEILVKPLQLGDVDLCRKYQEILFASFRVLSFNAETANVYAQLRTQAAIRPPDAIQLACAAVAKTDIFLTNDKRLHSLAVPGISSIMAL